uniref:Uncharacterized protein n=1 Tax=Physcomitrium patens TaxID=3218 RepID=A0A2K1IB91_PHYPA|nr:hypothetical protein PHYPA_030014 [Physcomitrium patens]
MPALTTVDSKLDYNQGFEPEEVIERRRESTRPRSILSWPSVGYWVVMRLFMLLV